MKRISILFLAVLLFKLSQAQVSQFPQIYYSGQVGGNSLIRANASLSASTLTTLRGNYNIGAESITSSTESYGTATWAKVCLPSTSSTNNTPNYGYTMYGSYYIRISENNNYAKVNTINDALGVRTCAGCISSRVTIGGQNAYYGKNSILALTGNISSGWYEIYLTNNCSQTTGWVDGQYLTFPSSQSYKIIGGSVTNSPNSAFVWGASINFSGLTSVNTTEGFFQYKVPANWSGTLTCSHPSYNTSSPTSISIFANNHYYTNNFVLSNVTPCTGVTITTPPQSQTKTVGNTATFSVVAGGTSPYTYQWKKNGTNISGATSSSYTTPTLTLSDNGNTYSCYLTNCSGNNNTTSNSATLSVTNNCTAVSITTHPQNQSKTVGNTATFSVVAGGISPYTYQWKKNGTNISGATSSSYTTPTLTLSDNGNTYSCYLTNCSGVNNVTSNNATLSVSNSCTSVSITTQPQNQSKTVGNTATFSVVAGGTSPYTYQWRKNGTNISGATSSTYVTPTLTLSDNGNTYSCYLTNCSGGNNTTSSSGTLTVTNNTPSQVILNNIIKNNTRFTNPKLLWSGYTNQTPDIIKICADASNATEITFVNNTGINSNNIRFLIASDPLGNDSEKSGYFIRNSENLSINGNIIKNKLTHPKYLEPQYKPSRIDTIIVVDVNNVNVRLFSIPIQIYRSPVVLVHGFTGGSDYIGDESFNVTKDYLVGTGNYLWNFIRVANYHTTSYQAFEVNQYVVPNNINNIFNEMRFNKISCGKVDVVGFSMGGCLSRIYLQTDACAEKEDIHKLITINTPHFGSQWGNLFSNPLTKPVVWPLIAAKIRLDLGNVNIEENLGAVYDLSVNSNAMYNLNYAPNFNRTVVPTHTIGTSFSYTSETNSIIEAVLRSVSIVNGFYAFNDYVNYLFYNEANDGAVKLNSQSGGLSGQYFSTFPNQFHLGANKNVSVMLELENALNFSSINTNYFTLNGLVRTIQESHYRLAMPDTIDNYELIQQGSITINYPLRGQSFSKNTLLSVNISSINGINRVFFAPINSTDKVTYIDTSLNNGDITYQIPNDAFGKITLLVLGYSNNDFISSDTVTININQDASLDSIVIYNSPLYLQELNTEALIIRAYFNDGHNYLMSNQDGLQYYLNDTTIAKYFYGNLIYGKMKGETDLTVIYGDKSLNVPVYVTERDTTIPILNINNIVTAIKNNPVSNIHYLKIYPNPTTGEFALQADIEIGEQVRIEVFNQTGQSVLLNEDKSSSKNYIKNISLSQFSSGVYYIILSTKSANYINKIMLTK